MGEGSRQKIRSPAGVRKTRRVSRLAAVIATLALAGAVLSSELIAQTSVFRGQIVADSSFDPLPGAQITLVELEKTADTGSDGEFRFTGLPAGELTVRIRMVGYTPQSVRIRVDGRDSLVFPASTIGQILPGDRYAVGLGLTT